MDRVSASGKKIYIKPSVQFVSRARLLGSHIEKLRMANLRAKLSLVLKADITVNIRSELSEAGMPRLIEELMTVEKEAFVEKNRYSAGSFESVFEKYKYSLTEVRSGRDLIGFQLSFAVSQGGAVKDTLYMAKLAFLEKYQNLGAGRILMKFLIDQAGQSGFKSVRFHAGRWSRQGADLDRFYESLGFEREDDSGVFFLDFMA